MAEIEYGMTKKQFWAEYGRNPNVAKLWSEYKAEIDKIAKLEAKKVAEQEESVRKEKAAQDAKSAALVRGLMAIEQKELAERRLAMAEQNAQFEAKEKRKLEEEEARMAAGRQRAFKRNRLLATLCLSIVVVMAIPVISDAIKLRQISRIMTKLQRDIIVPSGTATKLVLNETSPLKITLYLYDDSDRVNDAADDAKIARFDPRASGASIDAYPVVRPSDFESRRRLVEGILDTMFLKVFRKLAFVKYSKRSGR
ncbi:MAG: hypothetical protein LBT92_03260 [Rickettsiales bacterium]|nr:hypothetical protein [Rickettsiales bacterium]